MMTRRHALKTTALAGAALTAAPAMFAQPTSATNEPAQPRGPGRFILPSLPYALDALEPHIDARTMEIHHDKHHAGYTNNLNKAVSDYPNIGATPIEDILKNLGNIPEKFRDAFRNNGGGYYNHSLFWLMMKPGSTPDPGGNLDYALSVDFGSLNAFKQQFANAALKVFGSGWAWLVLDGKTLKITTTANQDTPLASGQTPLLGLDVWEHAYYLKHQNRRAEYITAWWNVVNWDYVAERFAKAKA